MVRAGSLILICHDCSDIFLEAAKICKYLHWQKACDACFGIFFLVWVATRLVILPFYLTEKYGYSRSLLKVSLINVVCLFILQYSVWLPQIFPIISSL